MLQVYKVIEDMNFIVHGYVLLHYTVEKSIATGLPPAFILPK